MGFTRATFNSFIITVTIDNVSKKIVGFNEELYKNLFYDKPPEFFDDVISYGSFFGASSGRVLPPTDFKYNPCWVGAHTVLTDYSKFSLIAGYYFDISINSIDDIQVTLDKTKSRIGDSGYDKATDTCKYYVDEDIFFGEQTPSSLFPFRQEHYDNIPKDLTGRVYLITKPNITMLIGYGSDPQ